MQLRLFLDEDVMSRALTHNLRARGVAVTSVIEEGRVGKPDDEQLDFATSQNRAICTGNLGDFLQLHTAYLTNEKPHAGIIVIPRQGLSIGEQVRRLLKLIKSRSAETMQNNIEFLSHW